MANRKSRRRKPPAHNTKSRKSKQASSRGSKRAAKAPDSAFYRHFDDKEGMARLPHTIRDAASWHREQAAQVPGMNAWVGEFLGCATSRRGAIRASALHAGLSDREADIAAELAEGLTNREIAFAMRISFHTARAHVRNIFKKLGASSRMEAINKLKTGSD